MKKRLPIIIIMLSMLLSQVTVMADDEPEAILVKDETFDLFIRTPSTALLNVFLDDELLTKYHKDFEIEDRDNGIFLIRFSRDIMKELSVGEHKLLIQLIGSDDIEETIWVNRSVCDY